MRLESERIQRERGDETGYSETTVENRNKRTTTKANPKTKKGKDSFGYVVGCLKKIFGEKIMLCLGSLIKLCREF